AVVAISSNDIDDYPADSPEGMKAQCVRADWHFPYVLDADQSVAKAYTAACTPDIFLFDADRQLVYRGQFDESRPGSGDPVTGADLTQAVEELLDQGEVTMDQVPSQGCNIKWTKGDEPDYFG
ncbi:MAG: thioredoxin family protein, partial [Candidatus Thermoplasmatota archaeon]|nr:thioredoxin family protein [Candidatus Thermoplasmatota archaeon]